MNQQKKFQKKKDREREVRKKVLRRRAKIREEARTEADKAKKEREDQATINKYTATIRYNQGERLSEAEIKERLNKNMEILAALQKEYEDFQRQREEVAKNPPDLSKYTLDPSKIEKKNFGGEAEVAFKPNEDIFENKHAEFAPSPEEKP